MQSLGHSLEVSAKECHLLLSLVRTSASSELPPNPVLLLALLGSADHSPGSAQSLHPLCREGRQAEIRSDLPMLQALGLSANGLPNLISHPLSLGPKDPAAPMAVFMHVREDSQVFCTQL